MILRLYVGTGFDSEGNPLTSEFALAKERHAMGHFARVYGGCTVIPTRGAWIDPGGVLVVEQGLVFEIHSDAEALTEHRARFESHYLQDLFRQTLVPFKRIREEA